MTTEQIMAVIGCTEEQARGLMAHMSEQGTWTKTQRTIKHCTACDKRQWHDGNECIICGGQS